MDAVQQQHANSKQTRSSTPSYHYLPLTSPSQIRIFTLYQGPPTAPLSGSLQHIDLDNPPAYESLSYEWGLPELAQEVLLETNPEEPRARLPITQSLHQALRDLRHEDRPRTLWADALCIDQTNLPERAQQVSLMGRVYRRASRVATYIGPDDGTSVLALSLMYSLLPLLTGATVSSLSIPPASDPRCTAFRALVLKGWAGRCWCAQEFLLNIDVIMLSGRHEMPWYLLPSIVQLVATHKLPHYLVPADPLFLRECLGAMFTMRGAMHLGAGYAPSLLELLILTYPMRATDPRDKIYALLGVAADAGEVGVVVDYACKVEDLYVDTARRLLEENRSATLLGWNLGAKRLDLPSWVPDWTAWRPGSMDTMVGKAHRAGGDGRPVMSVVGQGGRRLEVVGGIIDRVGFLSECVGPMFDEDGSSGNGDGNGKDGRMHHFLTTMLSHATNLPPYPSTTSPADILARTLTCDMSLDDEPAPENHVEFFNALYQSCSPSIHPSHPNPSSESESESPTQQPPLPTHAPSFRQNAHKRMRYRRLCVTSKSYFAAVPQEAREGDVLCVVEGAKGMYILRRAGGGKDRAEETYSLVGAAYVHGLMNGEALRGEGCGYVRGVVVLV